MSQVLTSTKRFVIVCELDDLPIGLGRAFRIGEHAIAIFRTRQGKLFAVENRCSHLGGILSEGMLAGDAIVCPMHAFRFDGTSGECDQPNTCSVPTFNTEVTDGIVRVEVPIN